MTDGTMLCTNASDPGSCSPKPYYAASAFQFAMGYLTLVATCLVWKFLQVTFKDTMPQPIEQGSKEAAEMDEQAMANKTVIIGSIDTWWANADGSSTTETKMEEGPAAAPKSVTAA